MKNKYNNYRNKLKIIIKLYLNLHNKQKHNKINRLEIIK